MNREELETLQQRVQSSPNLLQVQQRLQEELSQKMPADRFGFIDPITIIMIISVIIQVLNYCRNRNKRDAAVIAQDVQQANKLPPRRTIVLRRRMRKLWSDYCQQNKIADTDENLFLSAALAVVPSLDEQTVQEFVSLSE